MEGEVEEPGENAKVRGTKSVLPHLRSRTADVCYRDTAYTPQQGACIVLTTFIGV